MKEAVMHERNGASIRNIVEVLWETPPAHYDAHSKMLVNPKTAQTQRLDHRISSYQPKGYVAPHRHKVQEQIYHVLDGEGLMELDGERCVVRRHDVIHIPPGVEHAIYNSGLQDLVFLVVTTPPTDA
jgi:mannose-6-phosphate isomerase-like protein (cupin superfamily)